MAGGKEVTPQDKRNTDRLHRYWAVGQGAAKINWGVKGDFDRCVMNLGKYIRDAEGYCAKMHHEVLGYWPATHAKMDSKKAAKDTAKKAK